MTHVFMSSDCSRLRKIKLRLRVHIALVSGETIGQSNSLGQCVDSQRPCEQGIASPVFQYGDCLHVFLCRHGASNSSCDLRDYQLCLRTASHLPRRQHTVRIALALSVPGRGLVMRTSVFFFSGSGFGESLIHQSYISQRTL